MGYSGNRGYITWLAGQNPYPTIGSNMVYGAPAAPAGTAGRFPDEVTMFTVEERVEYRKYGHDKSGGAKDVVTGTWDATITLTAVANGCAVDSTFCRAGQVVYLKLYPFGYNNGSATAIAGYAALVRRPTTVDIDGGKPVEYTATFESKFMWTGLAGDNEPTGGFENTACGGSAGPTSIGTGIEL